MWSWMKAQLSDSKATYMVDWKRKHHGAVDNQDGNRRIVEESGWIHGLQAEEGHREGRGFLFYKYPDKYIIFVLFSNF